MATATKGTAPKLPSKQTSPKSTPTPTKTAPKLPTGPKKGK